MFGAQRGAVALPGLVVEGHELGPALGIIDFERGAKLARPGDENMRVERTRPWRDRTRRAGPNR